MDNDSTMNVTKPQEIEITRLTDEEFEEGIIQIINNMDGENVQCFKNCISPDVCDRVLIASFVSNKQVVVTVGKILQYSKSCRRKAKCPSQRKNIDSEWTAIDCGRLVIHLFKNEVREYYNLDKLFSGKENE